MCAFKVTYIQKANCFEFTVQIPPHFRFISAHDPCDLLGLAAKYILSKRWKYAHCFFYHRLYETTLTVKIQKL